MYNLRPIGMKMRYFSPTGNTDGINLCVAAIKAQLLYLVFHLTHFIALRNVLCVEQSAAGKQITLNRSVMTWKRSLIIVILNIRPNQVMNKLYNARLLSIKVSKMMMNVKLIILVICQLIQKMTYFNWSHFTPDLSNFKLLFAGYKALSLL